MKKIYLWLSLLFLVLGLFSIWLLISNYKTPADIFAWGWLSLSAFYLMVLTYKRSQ